MGDNRLSIVKHPNELVSKINFITKGICFVLKYKYIYMYVKKKMQFVAAFSCP